MIPQTRSIVFFIIGMAMGLAELVPGITATTVAFILATYESLLQSIKNFGGNFFVYLVKGRFKDAFESISFRFLAATSAGVACSLLFFYKVVHFLLMNPLLRVYMYAFFLGMIAASIKILKRKIVYWNAPQYLFLILGLFTSFWAISERMAGFSLLQPFLQNIALGEAGTMIFSGFLVIIALLLPGISISSLHFACGLGLPKFSFYFAIGLIIGIIGCSRLLLFLLKKYRDKTICFLLGTMLGSLPAIWPFGSAIHRWSEQTGIFFLTNRQFVFSLLFLIAGYFLFSAIQKWQKKEKKHVLIHE